MIKMKVYYIDTGVMDNKEAIKTGLKWLFEISNKSGTTSCIITIPTMRHIQDNSKDIHIALEDFSSGFAKILSKKRELTINGIQIKLVTEKTARYFSKSLVLSINPTKKALPKILGQREISELFVIPWLLEELIESLNIVKAINFSTNKILGQNSIDLDPVVIEALHALSISVNLSTGIGKGAHPNDSKKAKELFSILRKTGYILDSKQISTWLVTHEKWNPEHMDDVIKLINRINKIKTLRITYQWWNRNIINVLKEQNDLRE